jgi:orotidine 5'-phosphate decarboxylase subfamily 2
VAVVDERIEAEMPVAAPPPPLAPPALSPAPASRPAMAPVPAARPAARTADPGASVLVEAPCRLYADASAQDVQGGWLVVADMPPEADGRHGEPFAGDAGRLLDNMLRALKLHDGRTPVHLMRTHRGVAAGQPGSPRAMDEAFGEHAALRRLDPELAAASQTVRSPGKLKGDASRIYDFCARIVDATADLVIAFKPQIAYFAAHRAEGQLEQLMEHMRRNAPHVPVILDAKRGDIGSTAEQYAQGSLRALRRRRGHAVALHGLRLGQPYLKYEGKGAFLLCRTSNPGGDDLQNQRLADVEGQPLLYEHVARLAQGPWNLNGQLGLVVGATYPAEIERVRANRAHAAAADSGRGCAGRRCPGHRARRAGAPRTRPSS